MHILKFFLMIILSYLLGSIPSGVVIGKIFKHKDPRNFGSHNIGATNSFRVLGTIPGITVLIMDILKGTLAAYLPILFQYRKHWLVLFIGLFAVFGHTCSIFIHFKGGKAVATSAGVILAYNPTFFIVSLLIFLTILLLTSTASIASLLGSVLITIISIFFHDKILTIVSLLLTIFIFYRHKSNIKRIKEGKENILPFGLVFYLKNKKNR